MPSVTLTEIGQLRVETISFFLTAFFLSAAVVRWAWNALCRELPRIPRLTYSKACGVTLLWGLLFVVVLTMISGARELMTPGAWEKKGATYQLRGQQQQRPLETTNGFQSLDARRERITRLARELERYANWHEGRFPEAESDADIPADAWLLDERAGTRYIYIPGQSNGGGPVPLAYEPQVFDGAYGCCLPMAKSRLCLWTRS